MTQFAEPTVRCYVAIRIQRVIFCGWWSQHGDKKRRRLQGILIMPESQCVVRSFVRLHKLLGHTTPNMTLRYWKHSPEAYFEENSAKIAQTLTSKTDNKPDAISKKRDFGLRRA